MKLNISVELFKPMIDVMCHYLRTYAHACVFFMLIFFMCFNAISIYHNTPTYDEISNLEFGYSIIDGSLESASMQRMPILSLNALPLIIIKKNNFSVPEEKMLWICRFPTIVVSMFLGFLVFFWSKELYGINAGLFSLLLYVFCPNIVAHSRLITNDIYCSLFTLLTLYCFNKYLKTRRLSQAVITSLVMGLALLTKQTALLLLIFIIIYFFLNVILKKAFFIFKTQENKSISVYKQTALHSILFFSLILFVLNAGYGFKFNYKSLNDHVKTLEVAYPDIKSTVDKMYLTNYIARLIDYPIPIPTPYIEAYYLAQHYNKTGEGHGPIYLLGETSQYGWWYYYILALLFKTPIPTLVFFAWAFCLIFKKIKTLNLKNDEAILLIFGTVLFFFFSFKCTAQIGIRYLLPIMPIGYILAGQIIKKGPSAASHYSSFFNVTLSVWLIISFLSYFPHYISYFNDFFINRNELYRYLADSNLEWGQNNYYLVQYLASHRDEKIFINPTKPVKGKIIVNSNHLVGLNNGEDEYKWLRDNYQPIGSVAYTWIIFDVK